MAKISLKQVKKINHMCVFMDVIKEYENKFFDRDNKHWLDYPPDTWSKEQTELFDMMSEVENRIKNKILKEVWN